MDSATIKEALLEVSRLWLHEAAAGRMSVETADLYMQVSERLHRYAVAHGISRMDDVSKDLAHAFIAAPGRDRRNNITLNPAGSTRRQRRSAIASFFAHARSLGMTKAAPLLDSPPIKRGPRSPGASLTARDIESLQFHAERGMPATRHAALLALLLAGLHSAETAAADTTDLDLAHARVSTAGATRTHPRTCRLTEWGVYVLGLRAARLDRSGCGPHRLVTSTKSSRYGAQASVGAGFNDIARNAGLATPKRKVEPRDITRYVARQILHETGQLSEVARRLGLSSLDAAAGLAGLAWRNEDTAR
ncbi:hypothetical protein [Streptomyces sp. L2]|uniref:hypothetical protein n=1 Tax=Streptomyces sp. L2 TaxID=2162665 RepID=UPI001010E1DC|nr:hypothetical protein [Streptomyces sp. L2]